MRLVHVSVGYDLPNDWFRRIPMRINRRVIHEMKHSWHWLKTKKRQLTFLGVTELRIPFHHILLFSQSYMIGIIEIDTDRLRKRGQVEIGQV
jgi:hypothetical protein